MGVAFKPDKEFDIDRYVELLKKAIGGRSQTQFAKDCNLSVSYICKHINKKTDQAPLPTTLERIAKVAQNDVTYEELLDAAGYEPSKYLDKSKGALSYAQATFNHIARAIVSHALIQSNFDWKRIKTPMGGDGPVLLAQSYDLGISVENDIVNKWFFEAYNRNVSGEINPNTVYSYLSKISVACDVPNCKYSFIVDNEELYYELLKLEIPVLAVFVSVILVNTSALCIVKEEYLKTALIDKIDEIKSILI